MKGFFTHSHCIEDRLIDDEKTLIYIHIGKCGGASLGKAINESATLGDKYNKIVKIHINKPKVCNRAHYLIVIRNPIQRVISAFNWRYYLVVEDGAQRNRFLGEQEALEKYKTLNNLAEALYVDNNLCNQAAGNFEKIHHLHERIGYYLTDLLVSVNPNQIRFVLSQETLDSDIYDILCVKNSHTVHKHSDRVDEDRKLLTTKAYANLKYYLKEDYQALEQLLSICKTTNASKEVLLK